MKSYRAELQFRLDNRRVLVKTTDKVQASVIESGIQEGLVLAKIIGE